MPDFFFLTHEENIYIYFFSHFPFISMWGHIDPEDQKCKHFFYIPSEQPNQAQFFCEYIDNICKVTKYYSTEMKGTFFFY